MNKLAFMASAGVAAIVGVSTILGCFYTVDQGERAVVLTNGAISSVSGPGLHFKLPFIQGVDAISVQVQKIGFEKTEASGDQRMSAYTKDQQPATIALSVNYHVTDPVEVYSQFGNSETMEARIIDPRANEQVKNVFGQFNAVEAIQDRAKLNAEITDAIRAAVKGPVVVDNVQIEDVEFSPQYEKAVENRMEAQVRQQQAEAQKSQRMTNADAAKYEKEANADAIAYEGKQEAAAIQAKNDALKNSPDIVAYTAAQKWDGHLPATMVPGSAVPFIKVGAQ